MHRQERWKEFKNELKDLQNVREKLLKVETVAAPKMKNAEADGGNNIGERVLKVDLAMYFWNKREIIPDPLLLSRQLVILTGNEIASHVQWRSSE
jgi:hypothetical protein